MSRADRVTEIARREALAAAWAASAKELRAGLEADALAEFEAEGNGVTWTLRDIGRVTLPLSKETPVISDIDALKKWVEARHPEEIQTVTEIRAAYQTHLLGAVQIGEGGVVLDPETGEVIPGMAVREGGRPKALSITLERNTKALYAQYATTEVERQLAAEYGEPAEAVAEVRCAGCGQPIHEGEADPLSASGLFHAECHQAVPDVSV